MQKRERKSTAISMQFIAVTRRHCVSAYRKGNLEHQFRYRAGALPLQNDVKNVCSTPFFSLSFALVSYVYRMDKEKEAVPCTQ